MCHAPCSSILNRAQWIRFVPDLMVHSSDRTTSFSDRAVLAIIGLRDTTPRVPSWSTMCLMWCAKRPRDATVFRFQYEIRGRYIGIHFILIGFSTDTFARRRYRLGNGHTVSLKDPRGISRPNHGLLLGRSITKGFDLCQYESHVSAFRSRTPSLSPTTPLFPCINWSRTPTKPSVSTMRHFTTSASAL